MVQFCGVAHNDAPVRSETPRILVISTELIELQKYRERVRFFCNNFRKGL